MRFRRPRRTVADPIEETPGDTPQQWTVNIKSISSSRLLFWIGLLSCLFAAGYVAVDVCLPMARLQESDFLLVFYVGARIVRDGFGAQLYPALGHTDYWHEFFAQYAPKILPGVTHFIPALFMYPPPVALFFMPFTYLAPRTALILWEIICFACMYISAIIFGGWRKSFFYFVTIFLLLPVVHVLLIGQPTLVFALLPLVGGFALWNRGRNFWAGLVWCILWFKAQILLPLLTLVAAYVFHIVINERQKFPEALRLCAGLAAGTLGLGILSVVFVAPNSIVAWLSHVTTYSNIFTNGEIDPGMMFAGALPASLNLFVPLKYAPIYGKVIRVVVACMLALVCWLNYRILGSKFGNDETKRSIALAITLGSLPLTSLYLRNYDLAIWAVILWIYLGKLPEGELKRKFGLFMLVSFPAIDAYFATWTWIPFVRPASLVMLLVCSAMYIWLAAQLWNELRSGVSPPRSS